MQKHQHLQINVGHLKTEMVKKLGAERSKLYFFYLNRFLSLKITKVEFNNICFRVLRKENIALHNQLITSILRNAYHAKTPPEIHQSDECGVQSDKIQLSSTCKDQPHTFKSQSGNHEREKETADLSYFRRSLQAPLGLPISAVQTGGTRKAVAINRKFVSSYDCGELLDSVILKHRIEQIAISEGLQGVSLDCANLLNNALDFYLKGLIKPSTETAGNGCHIHNTFLPSNQHQIMLQEQRSMNEVSLLDFRVAMELNPQRLGEDWPLLLEKTCAQSHEE